MPHQQFHQADELRNEKDKREDNEAQERMTKNFANDVAVKNAHEAKIESSTLYVGPEVRGLR